MESEHTAIVRGVELPISMKASVEICSFIKHKPLKKAKSELLRVIEKKLAVPFKRFNQDLAHKPGKIAAGRYPVKTSQGFIELLDLLQANAENKGLDPERLVIYYASASRGPRAWHSGRKRRRRMKRTNVELRVKEHEEKAKEKKK